MIHHYWVENEVGKAVPATQQEWIDFIAHQPRFLATDAVGAFRVSTVFTGIDIPPLLLYSTGVLDLRGDRPALVREWTYETRAAALDNHQRVVGSLDRHQQTIDALLSL